MALAGSVILSIYGPAFRAGALWLDIVALACGTNCFVALAETVIMVQPPGLNLRNSAITIVIAFGANLWLIDSLGVTGAALVFLLPYVLLGICAHRTLRLVFSAGSSRGEACPAVPRRRHRRGPGLGCRFCSTGCGARFFGPDLSRCLRNGMVALLSAPMKRIFLTGASSGIGLAIAKSLSAWARSLGHGPPNRAPAPAARTAPGRARSRESGFVRRNLSRCPARGGAIRRRDQQAGSGYSDRRKVFRGRNWRGVSRSSCSDSSS